MPDAAQTSHPDSEGAPLPASGPGPSADALDASVRLARLRRQMFARVETPRIAQYHVLRQIGGGGMGLVFAAWDPTLDRIVAIKVLRDPWSSQAGAQLRREAMALARLRHPNVVSVFEVGEHEGQVYLAMEFVEGKTLREWMTQWRESVPRDLSVLIDVFVQAARGLAAAHGRRVVHRDVKPENTMIEAEGRVRLMDFGLAGREVLDDATGPVEREGAADVPVTRTAAGLAGTPAYMAPEQFDGESPGPQADQFSLCACLFEALYGRRIRSGHTLEAVAATADQPIGIPNKGGVPRRIEAVLRRGLALDPADRFASMDALADALLAVERSRRRQWIGIGAFTLATGGVLAGLAVASGGEAPCTGAAENLVGVWDEPTANALEERFAKETASFVPSAWATARRQLDAYTEAWTEQHTDACEDAQVRREISAEVMDLRMACLRDRQRHLGALVDALSEGGVEALSRAPDSIAALPSVKRCADADYVAQQGFRREDTEVTELVAEMLARAVALHHAGDTLQSREAAGSALAAAKQVGDAAGIARARYHLARNLNRLAQFQEAHDTMVEAYEEARRAGLPDIASRAAGTLVRIAGVELSDFEEGEWWMRIADLEAEPVDTTLDRMDRAVGAVALLQAAGRPEEAGARLESALAAADEVEAEDPRASALTRIQVGHFLLLTGKRDRGTALMEQGAATLVSLYGEDHPINASAERPLALAARLRGDMPAGIAHASRALTLQESAVGTRSVALSKHLDSLANSLSQSGRVDEADALLERALTLDHPRPLDDLQRGAIYRRRAEVWAKRDPVRSLEYAEKAYAATRAAVGDQHRRTVMQRVALGAALGANGRTEEARETMEAALAVGQVVMGLSHPDVGTIHHQIGREHFRAGEWEEAAKRYQKAVDVLSKVWGPTAYSTAPALANLCGALVQLQRSEEALPACERALEAGKSGKAPDAAVMPQLENNFGTALLGVGRYEEGRAALERSRDGWRAGFGPGSLGEAMAVSNIGEAWELEGDCTAALARYRESLAMRVEKFGEDHPVTKPPREGIARCEKALGASKSE